MIKLDIQYHLPSNILNQKRILFSMTHYSEDFWLHNKVTWTNTHKKKKKTWNFMKRTPGSFTLFLHCRLPIAVSLQMLILSEYLGVMTVGPQRQVIPKTFVYCPLQGVIEPHPLSRKVVVMLTLSCSIRPSGTLWKNYGVIWFFYSSLHCLVVAIA